MQYRAIVFFCLCAAGAACARTIEVGEGRSMPTLSRAGQVAQPGDVIRIAPGTYFDCAVLSADGLTVRGSGAGVTILTDKVCNGKGILVTTGANITVSDLTLARARVPDRNGAGLRAEGAGLTVERVTFTNNENGILAGDSPSSVITVADSTFDRNGFCGDACAHAIYAGHIAALRVLRSHFTGTRQGHSVKSRARETAVENCTFADGADGTSSYLIDIPNGGALRVIGNTMEKGPESGNSAAMEIGAEGVEQPTPEIRIEHNIFRNDLGRRAVFLNNVTATEAALTGNQFEGLVTPLEGDGLVRP